MAYLVDTVAPNGIAVAVTGYIMRNDMTGWTKHPRRIEWADLIKQWSRQPTIADVRKVKARLPERVRGPLHTLSRRRESEHDQLSHL
jgi:hypothetical protein